MSRNDRSLPLMGGSVTDGKLRACLAIDKERAGNPSLQGWDERERRTREGLVPVASPTAFGCNQAEKYTNTGNGYASKNS